MRIETKSDGDIFNTCTSKPEGIPNNTFVAFPKRLTCGVRGQSAIELREEKEEEKFNKLIYRRVCEATRTFGCRKKPERLRMRTGSGGTSGCRNGSDPGSMVDKQLRLTRMFNLREFAGDY